MFAESICICVLYLAACIWAYVISAWCVACPIGYLLPECVPQYVAYLSCLGVFLINMEAVVYCL